MAEKKAKTAEKSGAVQKKACPALVPGARSAIHGYGPRGYFWVCDKNCGYQQRTR